MTSGIPGRAAPALPDRVAPVARISRSALRTNLRAVLATDPDAAVDVRADAWGHGVEVVARIALECGAASLLVDAHGARRLAGEVEATRITVDAIGASPEAVYGLTPGFRPVLSLHGCVLSLKDLRAGEAVSYGYSFRTPRDTVIALVTGGYAQGVVRALGNAVTVHIAGERHPIVGRVAMDVCVVDVGPDAFVSRGEDVVFFGDDERSGRAVLADWTAATGLGAAELVTAVGLANRREYVS